MKLFTNIMDSQFWRSIFRTRLPIKTNLDRSLIIFNSLALHIHPVKVRERAIRFSYTFYLGTITFSLFVVLVSNRCSFNALLSTSYSQCLSII